MAGKHRKQWLQAEQEELDAQTRRRAWKAVVKPPGAKLISSRWVYKYKLKKDNTVDRYKARLVARGYLQRPGVDYHDTFAAVALTKSLSFESYLRILLP